MKTKKKKLAFEVGSVPAPSVPIVNDAVNPEIPAQTDAEKPNRVSFFVTPEGVPDFSRMHARTKNQLSELLRNKNVQKELGITPEESKRIEEIGFGEDEANALLDVISGVDSVAASRIYKIPREVTSQAFAFTLDHRKKINPALIRVLNKWGPAVLKTWKDEIGLGIIIFATLNSQVTLMHILEARRQKTEKAAPRPNVVTPISEPAKPAPEEKPSEVEPISDTIGLNAS